VWIWHNQLTEVYSQVLHSVEECSETLAFASEPVYGSLANILAYQEERPQGGPPPQAREYNFLEIELKYGLLQVSTLNIIIRHHH
jgi:SCY1-like protein 2